MSIKVMTLVWDSALEREHKFVALAYADWANDDGENIYPATDRVAWKTGYSERQVRAITKKLRELSILILQGQSSYRTNLYKMITDNLPKRQPYQSPPKGRPIQKVGAEIAPTLEINGCENFHKRVQLLPQMGAKTAPDPLYIHHISSTSEDAGLDAKTIATNKNHRDRTLAALQNGMENHQEDALVGIDLVGFPEDLHDIIREACKTWGMRTPVQKSKRAKWIGDAREMKHTCGELGLEPMRKERQRVVAYMQEHQGVAPYTYKDIGSLVGPVGGMAAQMRSNGNGKVTGAPTITKDGIIYA